MSNVNTQQCKSGEESVAHRALPPKLTAPTARNLYDRERLYARLDQLRQRHRALWISAPGGSGKTSLVRGYLAARALPVIWYRLDAGDGDVASFLYYLGLAVNQTFSANRTPMPVLTLEYLGDVTTFARNFFRELYSRMPAGHVLVLDNYQEVPEQSLLHDVLRIAISEAPDDITLLVLSRVEPPSTLVSFNIKGIMGRLDWADLQLTPEETDALIAQHLPQSVMDEATVSALHSLAGGWAAGVVLLAEQARQFGSAATSRVAPSGQKVIFDFFASELFARAEPALQRFLARTSLLPQMSAATAMAITGETDAEAILDDLARRNFFTVRHPGAQGDYFEYHPLFREFLAAQASRLFPAEELETMRLKAAHALQAVGDVNGAVDLFVRAEAWNDAAAIALAQAPLMYAQGRGTILLEWLTRIPESSRAQLPWAAFWIGVCKMALDPVAAKSALESAYHEFTRQGDAVGRYTCWCTLIDAVVLGWGTFVPLDPWLDEAEELQKIPAPSADLAERFACAMFTALLYRRPERNGIVPWEQKAWNFALHGDNLDARIIVGHNLVIYYAWYTGELSRAKTVLEALRPLVQQAGTSPLNRIGFSAAAGAYLWMSGQPEVCLREVREAIELADATGVHVWDAMLCTQVLFSLIPYGNDGSEYLARFAALLPHARPMERSLYHYFRAWLDFAHGAAEEACVHLRAALEMAQSAGALYPYAVYQWGLALALHSAGKGAECGDLIAQSRRAGEDMQAATLLYEALLAEAEIHLLSGDIDAAVASTREFLAIGARHGFRCHTFWRTGIMSRLYALALAHGIETEYVTSMIRHYHLPPPEGELTQAWPCGTQIFALGRVAVEREGEPLLASSAYYTKPVALLLALVVGREAGVQESKLVEMLWPDSAGKAAGRQTLRVTLNRLLSLVGEGLVIARDGRLTLDRSQCWADVWELDRVMARVRDIGVRGASNDEVVRLCRALRETYRGRLFDDDAHEFLLLEGERLHDLVIQGCTILAAQLLTRGLHEELLALVSWGLAAEPAAEALYQFEMRAYLASAQPVAGLAAYDRCRRMLATRLGVRPCAQTEALAEALRNAAA